MIFWICFILWTVVAAGMDLKSRRVGWWWTLLGLLLGFSWRLEQWNRQGVDSTQVLIVVLVVLTAYQLWRKQIWGGADAKTCVVLVLCFPYWQWLVWMGVYMSLLPCLAFLGYLGSFKRRGLQITTAEKRIWWHQKIPLVSLLCLVGWLYVFAGRLGYWPV